MAGSGKQNYLRGAAILAATAIIVKIIGALFKIPLFNLLGDEGTTQFQLTYTIYTLLLSISTAGIPVALSRQISAAASMGRRNQVSRYFSIALPAFALMGAAFSALMYCFSDKLAVLMGDYEIAAGIRTMSPAVMFCCIIAVFEGYAQGHGEMKPTAVKQILEVSCKLLFGLAVSWWFLKNGYGTPTAAAGAIIGVPIGLGIALPVMAVFKHKIDKDRYGGGTSARDVPDGCLRTLVNVFKVSIPITLGASFINIMTLIDMRLVLYRLQIGAGFSFETAKILVGVYSKALTFFIMPSSLIVPLTVSIIPAISAAVAKKRMRAANEVVESSVRVTNLWAMPAGVGLFVLAQPIFRVLYWNSNESGPACLAIFGIASYFSCMQLVTTAILQAVGKERIPAVTYPIGGAVEIALDWVLVANRKIGIIGSPIGTLACYAIITALNGFVILRTTGFRFSISKAFFKPALCTAAMGVAARSVYGILMKTGSYSAAGTGRLAMTLYLTAAVAAAVLVYAVLVIATGTVTAEDIKLLPKGERLARFLKSGELVYCAKNSLRKRGKYGKF